jgi:hypothetical protein
MALASPTTLNGIEQVRSLNVDPRGARSWSVARLSRGRRQVLLLLLHVAESAGNRLASFARYRTNVKVRVSLSSLRPLAAAGIIMVALTLSQGWHQVHIAAATSRVDYQSEQNSVRRVEPFRPVPGVQVSHMQVSDRAVLPVVQALSRYEIRGLRRQADYGDDSAAFVMGMVYETGRYVPQSCTKAAEWVTRSANEGNAAAQYNLGLRYRDGDGVPSNEAEAEKWLRKAANQRYSNARLALKTLPTDQKLRAHSSKSAKRGAARIFGLGKSWPSSDELQKTKPAPPVMRLVRQL